MRILYFDCFSGISGNMALGALLDLGIEVDQLNEELRKVKVDGWHLHVTDVKKNGIGAKYVDVHLKDEHGQEHDADGFGHEHNHEHSHEADGHEHNHEHSHEADGHEHGHGHSHEAEGHSHSHEHSHNGDGHTHSHEHTHEGEGHSHHHAHVHRTYGDILRIIDESTISENAKKLSKNIFYRVAKAEAKVHQEPVDEVHFHEVGAIDSIIDIIGTAILIDMVKPDRIYASIVNDGYGFTYCQHGQIPIPVPATVEIFSDANVLCRQIDIDKELVTPTGAAIIAELASEYGQMPLMKVARTGYGAGKRDIKIPNVLRVVMGESIEETVPKTNSISDKVVETEVNPVVSTISDKIMVMETNIDDSSPEILGYVMELLLEAGALDVFYTSIQMKKNRPATKLTVLCKENLREAMERILFTETTTIGIRVRKEDRTILNREPMQIDTKFGKLLVKKTSFHDIIKIMPEYESAKQLAMENSVPLREVYNSINK
ncbi:MAG TPA: nickel pincer cofactor biosynthesis protein LarC [Lachnospiraceae bacterium]|nr:nickel pincer cofactor biosynthesis protein LarC [Lachnospiraceae bacterium]